MEFYNSRNQQDHAWKDMLDVYFKECIQYCLPKLANQINWNLSIVSLDKELTLINKHSETGTCLVDKLFKVYLINGNEQWILIHIEIQGNKNESFPQRMFTYAYRIWDKYQKQLVSCAILTDDNKNWRPNYYEVKFIEGSSLKCEFLAIKLLDYNKDELEKSNNIFASVILIQLLALEAKTKSPEQRKNYKYMLSKRLFNKGFSKQEISNLYKFIDFLIGLPKEFEIEYRNEIDKLEENKKMVYITSIERLGMEKGMERGKEEAAVKHARRMLAKGFNLSIIAEITDIPLKKIQILKQQSLKTNFSS